MIKAVLGRTDTAWSREAAGKAVPAPKGRQQPFVM